MKTNMCTRIALATAALWSLGLGTLAAAQPVHLLVSGYDNGWIIRYDGTTGAWLGQFDMNPYGPLMPRGLLFDQDGRLYVADANTPSAHGDSVVRYDGTTGAFIDEFVHPSSGGLNYPMALAFGPDGRFFVASWFTHSVLRYDRVSAAFLGVFVSSGSGGLQDPFGMVFGPDGNLYVSSLGTHRILRYDGMTGPSSTISSRSTAAG